jgi:glycosyltransferase involved in cell wall biosynthesis
VSVLRRALDWDAFPVSFCIYDRYLKAAREVSRDKVRKIVDDYGSSQPNQEPNKNRIHQRRRSVLSKLGRELEKRTRVGIRSGRAFFERRFGSQSDQPSLQPYDLFVVSGGTWDCLPEEYLRDVVLHRGLRLSIIVCDLIPLLYPHHFEDAKAVAAFSRFFEFVAEHSSLSVSISQSTKHDFDQMASRRGIRPRRSEVIHMGLDSNFTSTDTSSSVAVPQSAKHLVTQEFVLTVGSIQVRKNHDLLYRIWRRFAEEQIEDLPKLVIVGHPGFLTNDLLYQIERDPLIRDRIAILPQADDCALKWLYANALFSVYPSLYEGWGLPIVESLMHGRPCIASSTSSMQEASQGLALHLDPADFRSWYDAILHWHRNRLDLQAWSERIQRQYRHRTSDDFCNDWFEELSTIMT